MCLTKFGEIVCEGEGSRRTVVLGGNQSGHWNSRDMMHTHAWAPGTKHRFKVRGTQS